MEFKKIIREIEDKRDSLRNEWRCQSDSIQYTKDEQIRLYNILQGLINILKDFEKSLSTKRSSNNDFKKDCIINLNCEYGKVICTNEKRWKKCSLRGNPS